MRALGLGVIVEAGPGSRFKVGDNVSGAWGEFCLVPSNHQITRIFRYDGICNHEGQKLGQNCVGFGTSLGIQKF